MTGEQKTLADALADLLSAHAFKPSCQAGLMHCRCVKCATERARLALAEHERHNVANEAP